MDGNNVFDCCEAVTREVVETALEYISGEIERCIRGEISKGEVLGKVKDLTESLKRIPAHQEA